MAAPTGSALHPEVASLLEAPDKNGIARYLNHRMSMIHENEATQGTLRGIRDWMVAQSSRRGLSYVLALRDALLLVPGLRDAAFVRERFQLILAVAQCCVAHGAFSEAEEMDLKILNVAQNLQTCLSPSDRLDSAVRLMQSVERTGHAQAADVVVMKAMSLYRHECRELSAHGSFAAASPLLMDFLSALGGFLQCRQLLVEASRVHFQRYLRSGVAADFSRAVLCALLAPPGPARVRLIDVYHTSPSSESLGELRVLLTKAFQTQIFRHADVETLLKNEVVAGSGIARTTVRVGVNQHNILAVSKLYDNISFATLARLLDSMDEDAAAAAAVEMIMAGQLKATVDQARRWITFRHFEMSAALLEYDARINAVCTAVSRATDIITEQYPDYRSYLQE